MNQQPCPGSCNRATRRAINDLTDPADAEARAALAARLHLGDPIWHPGCVQAITAALLDLLPVFVQLELDKHHGTSAGAEHVSGSKTRPSPSPVADAQDELVRWLTAWEDTIRDLHGFTARPARLGAPGSRSEAATFMGAITFLAANLPWALAHPDIAVDLGNEILREHRALEKQTALGQQRTRKKAPCPRCGLRLLVHEAGESYIACTNPDCGRLLKLEEYDQLSAALLRSDVS